MTLETWNKYLLNANYQCVVDSQPTGNKFSKLNLLSLST